MSFVFLLVGGVLFGMGLAGVLGSKSHTLKPKHLRTKTSRYYTLGQLGMIKFKEWFKTIGKDEPAKLHFSGSAPDDNDGDEPDEGRDNPLP